MYIYIYIYVYTAISAGAARAFTSSYSHVKDVHPGAGRGLRRCENMVGVNMVLA